MEVVYLLRQQQNQQENSNLNSGKDIAEGTNTDEVSGSDEIVGGVITTPESSDYDTMVL